MMHKLRDYNGKSREVNMAFQVIETQEQLDAIVGERVARAKDSARKEFDGWISPDALAKQTENLNTQLGSLNDQLKALTEEKAALESQLTEKNGQIAKYETDSVKTKVAREFGLSYEAAEFLRGDTEEDIRKSAESLKGIVGKSFTSPSFNPDPAPAGDPTQAAWREMARDLFND